MAVLQLDRLELLRRYLTWLGRTPFRYGETDCVIVLGTWIKMATGQDPAADLRGRYRTALGWRRIVNREAGDLRTFIERRAALVGWGPREGEPRPGDIGLVLHPATGLETGAVRTPSGFWAAKVQSGVTAARIPALAVWGPQCRKP